MQGHATAIQASSGHYVNTAFDALGRAVAESSAFGSKTLQYDLAGWLTQMTWPDAFYVTYDHLVTGEVSAIRENGAASGIGVLGSYAYDDLGRPVTLTRGNGVVSSYGFNGASRLTSLANNLAGTAQDVTSTFTFNPVDQIASKVRNNDAYAWAGDYNITRAYTPNGLNQLTSAGSVALG